MKKLLVSFSGLILFLFLVVPVFPWGSATHAYIATRIGRIFPYSNTNEIYGSMVPDLFNYVFSLTSDQMATARLYTHGIYPGGPGKEGFMDVWYKASWWGYQKSLAYGFVAHNDCWGADSVAHHSGINVGVGLGYVIFKSNMLLNTEIEDHKTLSEILLSFGVTDPYDQLELAHNIFEVAGDIYLTRQHPFIGERIIAASLLRSDDIITLLTKVFGISWKDLIITAENDFRQNMILYGTILSLDQGTAINLMARQMAQLGIAYLKARGYQTLPSLDEATILANKAIRAALTLCYDYMAEVEATIDFVKSNLRSRGIWY